jgi:hypothetical protein
VLVTDGDVIVNSSCSPNAVQVNGSSGIAEADGFYVVGEANDPHDGIDAPIFEGSLPVPDPYEGIPTPPVNLSPTRSCSFNGPGLKVLQPGRYACNLQITNGQTFQFEPGAYEFNQLRIQGGTANFGSGTYAFLGGGFTYNGGTIDASAGVLFYDTCASGSCGSFNPGDLSDPFDHTCSSMSASGGFKITGNGTVTIAPFPGEVYSNVVFFQDRCSTAELDFSGTSTQLTADPTGAIYGKNGHIDYGGTATGGLQMVSDTIEIRGTANLDINVSGGAELPPRITWSLVE